MVLNFFQNASSAPRSSNKTGHVPWHQQSLHPSAQELAALDILGQLNTSSSGNGKAKGQCPVCPFYSNHSTRFEEHQRIHTGEKPFSCPVCPRTFAQRTNLTTHLVRVHAMAKQFACAFCGKPFAQTHSLKAHESTCALRKSSESQ